MALQKKTDRPDDEEGDGKPVAEAEQRDLGRVLEDAFQNNPEMLRDDFKNKSLVGKLKELRDAILNVYERRLRKVYGFIKEGPKKTKTQSNTPKLRR